MKELTKELLTNFIKTNVSCILVDFINSEDILNSVIIKNINDLNPYYEGINYIMPNWYNELNNKKFLVIDKIDKYNDLEQLKFIELIKYRQIDTNKINDNIVIIITTDNIKKVNQEILDLVAVIKN